MSDPVLADLNTRIDAALDRGENARDLVGRLIVWEDAVKAQADGHLKDAMTTMRGIHTATKIRIFRRLDELLGVPRRPWWACGRDRGRVYDAFSDVELMETLATVVTEK